MALCPSTVASSGQPMDLYFALKDDIPAPQVLSQNGNTISLSGGGGSVNVASTTAVALSTQKLTAVTYDNGLLATNVDGILTVGEGSIIGSTEVEGGRIAVSRGDAPPSVQLVDENTSASVTMLFDGTAGITRFDNTAYLESRSGAVEGIKIGSDTMTNTVVGLGLQMKIGGNEANLATHHIAFSDQSLTQTIDIVAEKVTTTATDEVKLDNAVNTVTLGQSKLDILGSYGVNIYGNSGDIVLGDGASIVNNTLLTVSDTNQSVKLTNATQSTDYFEQQLSTTIGGTSNLIIKSESGGVRFHNSSNVQRATFNYAQLTDKITMECVGTGTVALTAGTGGLELSTDSDLVFTGAALQSATSGGSSGQHLRIKLNGVFYKIKLEND